MSSKSTPPGGRETRSDERRWVRIVAGMPTVLSQVENASYGAEQYRNLAFQVEQRKQQTGGECLVVAMSSPDPGAGKTLTSLNLALTMARESEQRVLLVEGDLWKPTMREYLEVQKGTPGLAQVLAGSCTIDDAVTTIWGTNLDVLFAGEMGRRTGLMAHRRLSRAVEEMRSGYEVVVVDSPPIVLASGRALAACADAVLAIVRSGKTRRRGIEEALNLLGPNKVLGFVLNGARLGSASSYYYYSGYTGRTPLEERAAQQSRRKRALRIGAGITGAVASVALGLWLMRSSPSDGGPPAAGMPGAVGPAAEGEGLASLGPEPSLVTGANAALIGGARAAAGSVTRYDVSYALIDFPGGDPGLDRGTAADLIVRAFRQAGLDLQQEIHQDLVRDPRSYGASEPDSNIDHRRVRNLMNYFERNGLRLDAAVGQWQPGDLVFWSTDTPGWPNHVGIVSDRRAESGDWLVIHHFKGSSTGSGAEEDVLDRWPIEGHFRWTAAQEG